MIEFCLSCFKSNPASSNLSDESDSLSLHSNFHINTTINQNNFNTLTRWELLTSWLSSNWAPKSGQIRLDSDDEDESSPFSKVSKQPKSPPSLSMDPDLVSSLRPKKSRSRAKKRKARSHQQPEANEPYIDESYLEDLYDRDAQEIHDDVGYEARYGNGQQGSRIIYSDRGYDLTEKTVVEYDPQLVSPIASTSRNLLTSSQLSPTDSDFVHVPPALPDASLPNGDQSLFGEILALSRERVSHAGEDDSNQLVEELLGERSPSLSHKQEEEEEHLDDAEGLFSSSIRRSYKNLRRIKSDGKSTTVSDPQSTSASDQKRSRYEKGSSTSGRSNETEIDEVGSNKTGQTSLDSAPLHPDIRTSQPKPLDVLHPQPLVDDDDSNFIAVSSARKARSKRSKSSAKSDSTSSQTTLAQAEEQDIILSEASSFINPSEQSKIPAVKKKRNRKKQEVELDKVGELVGIRDGFEGF